MLKKNVRLWDLIDVETSTTSDDPRTESRKIKAESINKIGRIDDREERRDLLNRISERSLEYPMEEKRSMTVVKPIMDDFYIQEKTPEFVKIGLNGEPFKRSPYGDIGLFYRWRCPKPCRYCTDRSHRMQCFDWGANVLYRKYDDVEVAKVKVKNMCYYRMKYDFDTWFALGTHSRRPWKKWMIVGLLWMKKDSK